jgi:Holliday junction resolvase RusA-like endonuclease
MDALKGIAWRDDAQVAELTVRKFIASGYEQPHTQIRIEQIHKAEGCVTKNEWTNSITAREA